MPRKYLLSNKDSYPRKRPSGLSYKLHRDPEERFFSYVAKTGACWNWTSAIGGNGYGVFSYRQKSYKAHRFVYTMLVSTIPKGLELDHKCCNKLCVNPEHLEPVTRSENVRRWWARRSNAVSS